MNLVFECGCEAPRRISNATLLKRVRVCRNAKAPSGTLAEIRRDMVRMRRLLMVDGQKAMSAFLVNYFNRTLNAIVDKVEATLLKAGHHKAILRIDASANEAIWAEAIREVLGNDATVQLLPEYVPIVQSIAARSYARTAIFLGEAEAPNASLNILRRAQDMGRQITRINETTRKQIVDKITAAMEEGQTVVEVAKTLRAAIPEMTRTRISTIARTEVGNALDHGVKEAAKQSTTLATMDVIGCMAVEPNIPTFDGRPTCNIIGVPVERIDELTFHVNHTGCIVVGSFRR